MRFAVITLFPEMFCALTEQGICSSAFKQGQAELLCVNPRDFTEDKHRTVDDRPFGGGPGMVMKYAPLADAVEHIQAQGFEDAKVVYLSPQGTVFTQTLSENVASNQQSLILICGRYEGIDERFIEDYVDEEWSLGDFVLSGGELPAMVMIDTIVRLLPDVLGHAQSAQQDSFSQEATGECLLDHPHYTRPEVVVGRDGEKSVPEVLMSGNHKRIDAWRKEKRVERTKARRPDLLES